MTKNMKAYWDENWTAWEQDREPSSFARKALKLFTLKGVLSVLDLGCGTGRDSLFFMENGMHVTAVDVSQVALDAIRRPNIRKICAGLSELSLEPVSFDAVYAHLSLHYFDDAATRRIIGNIFQALKPGGVFCVRCKSVKDRLYGQGIPAGPDMFEDGHLRHFFSPRYMQDILGVFDACAVTETKEDYYGPCAFVEGTGFKNGG